ncbi:hypothetical protein BZ21_3160 [Yersinia pseudotuberculosis]|uniref:TnsA endonuclease N-terminal domain-containing protein n=1 Tax=Yersinia TaxID=629 RepID=UPI0001739945|nr:MULTISPECIES: TnsA endonuclease N-terminal domain-containing protein [Yersinia]ELM3738358.1 Tn7 transposase TnsA N-terminal domain-containing protein [Yersinia ruckeri]CQD56502.1 TnsA endonuclease [Yersinia intermedia]AJJ01226.1 hypothetical protein BZ21_3160 [Yersinia pseudotuberculosis]AJJ66775.1 hypothetical protein BZ16_3273 [Yersinia pseudotuberculosis PB1/+]AYX16490.1 heteromeric transposase endonuclease subunit TnsA [Yersinia pseudotuberculosis]
MSKKRQLETQADFQRALKNRYGLGEGNSYKPWLRVQDVSSYGNSAKIRGIKTNREHHTLSEHETCFFYIAEFCDSVIDIREQFPLLPIGLSLKIAKTLGIEHPKIPNTSSYNVMSTDFVLTIQRDGLISYDAVSVKPINKLSDKRTAEKLEIERLWWQLQGIPFHLFVATEQNRTQSQNIEWATWPLRHGVLLADSLLDEAVLLMAKGKWLTEELCRQFIQKLGAGREEALMILRILIGTKRIVVDLNKMVVDSGIIDIKDIKLSSLEIRYVS